MIDEFIEIYGLDRYNKLVDYIVENNLVEEFNKAYMDKDKLFEFAVKYGMLDIVTFLYEYIRVSYNFNIVTGHNNKIAEKELDPNAVPINALTDGSCGLNISFQDRYSKRRNECLRYLINIRSKSKMSFSNGNFFYRLSDKYV